MAKQEWQPLGSDTQTEDAKDYMLYDDNELPSSSTINKDCHTAARLHVHGSRGRRVNMPS